jgi:hypothetical protein
MMPSSHIRALAALPPVSTTRWTRKCKAAIAFAYALGAITHDEVKQRFGIPLEELNEYVRRYVEGEAR